MPTTIETGLRVVTLQEAARILKVRESRVRIAIHSGELKASRIGRLWRLRVDDVERYLDATAGTAR